MCEEPIHHSSIFVKYVKNREILFRSFDTKLQYVDFELMEKAKAIKEGYDFEIMGVGAPHYGLFYDDDLSAEMRYMRNVIATEHKKNNEIFLDDIMKGLIEANLANDRDDAINQIDEAIASGLIALEVV